MSGLPTRLKPRWSRLGEVFVAAWLIAGLPRFSAIVLVGPPFWARSRSLGFLLTRSPRPSNPHVFLSSRSCPEDFTAPSQLAPVVAFPFAMIELRRCADSDDSRFPPRELVPSAVLPASVTLWSTSFSPVPPVRIPPPAAFCPLARLFAIVLLVNVAVAFAISAPPPSLRVPLPVAVTLLSLIVLPVTVTGPPLVLRPPPAGIASLDTSFSSIVDFLSVSLPVLCAAPRPLAIPPPVPMASELTAELSTVVRTSFTMPTQFRMPPPPEIAPPSTVFWVTRLRERSRVPSMLAAPPPPMIPPEDEATALFRTLTRSSFNSPASSRIPPPSVNAGADELGHVGPVGVALSRPPLTVIPRIAIWPPVMWKMRLV